MPACTGHGVECVSQHAGGQGVSARVGGCLLGWMSTKWGVCLGGGVCPGVCVWQTPPARGQTDTCENITFANVCGR